MLKAITSNPELALASSMAALSVHRFPIAASASHTPSPGFRSKKSAVELTTSVPVLAWAGLAANATSKLASATIATSTSTTTRLLGICLIVSCLLICAFSYRWGTTP